jgi:hypothetical protein
MALLNSGFLIDDPTEISGTMQQILRAELGLPRTGEFEEIAVEVEEDDSEQETVEQEIPDDSDNVGEEVTIESDIPEDNADL